MRDIKAGRYYLVRNHGVFGCAVIRAGKEFNDRFFIGYMGRCRVRVLYSEVVREVSKEENKPPNMRNLADEVHKFY